jgi:hypothetical protein
VIFVKLCFHVKNLEPSHFLDIVAEFEALLVGLLIVWCGPIIGRNHVRLIINLCLIIILIDWSIELYANKFSQTCFGLDTCLNDFNLLPIFFIGSSLEFLAEFLLSKHSDFNAFSVSDQCPVCKPWALSGVVSRCASLVLGRNLTLILVLFLRHLFLFYLLAKELLHRLETKVPWMSLRFKFFIVFISQCQEYWLSSIEKH